MKTLRRAAGGRRTVPTCRAPFLAFTLTFLCALAALAPSASASDAVIWGATGGDKLAFANLDNSAAGNLAIPSVANPYGVAIDAAAGRVYWTDVAGAKISFSNLDGTGGGNLPTTGATVSTPTGLAIDPAGGRVYWANQGAGKISFARLDGSGGGDINTVGAPVSSPIGVAVDPAVGRVYWANSGTDSIAFANLDGSGGAAVLTAGATLNNPAGVAVNSAASRVYWTNNGGGKVSFASTEGSGGGDLATTGATSSFPIGLALDPDAGRVYWASGGTSSMAAANLNGSGGFNIPTGSASVDGPSFPVVFRAPAAAGPPSIDGAPSTGAPLACSQGTWAPDLLGSFLYRAPASFGFQWLRDGIEIPGAGSAALVPDAPGQYTCRVTARNFAGATSQTSAPLAVDALALGKTKLNMKKGTATISVDVPAAGRLALSGKGIAPQSRNAEAGVSKLTVKAKGKAKSKLKKKEKLKVKIAVVFTPTGGQAVSETKSVTLKLKKS